LPVLGHTDTDADTYTYTHTYTDTSTDTDTDRHTDHTPVKDIEGTEEGVEHAVQVMKIIILGEHPHQRVQAPACVCMC
jgi:hypothetical protein